MRHITRHASFYLQILTLCRFLKTNYMLENVQDYVEGMQPLAVRLFLLIFTRTAFDLPIKGRWKPGTGVRPPPTLVELCSSKRPCITNCIAPHDF